MQDNTTLSDQTATRAEGAAEKAPPDRPSFRRGLAFASGSFVSTVLLSILSSIITARLYGIRVIGLYALASAPYILLTQISTLREQAAFVRRAAVLPRRSHEATGLLIAVIAFSSVFTLVIGVFVGLLNALVLNTAINQTQLLLPSVLMLIAYLLFENTSWNLDMMFGAYGAGKELFWFRMCVAISFTGAAVAIYPSTHSVWGPVLAQIASMVVGFLVRLAFIFRYAVARVEREWIQKGFRQLPDMLKFGLRVAPGGAASSLAYQSMVWTVGSVATTTTLGAFSRALGLSGRLLDAAYRINEMMFPRLASANEKQDHRQFAEAMGTGLRLAVVGLFGIASCAAGASSSILGALFGREFAQGGLTMSILLVGMVVTVIGSLLDSAIIAAGRPLRSTVYACLGAAVSIATLIPLAIAFKGPGAAAGFLLGALVQVGAVVSRERAAIFTRAVEALLMRTILAAGVAGVAAAIMAHLVSSASWSALGEAASGVTAGAITYIVIFVILGGLTQGERSWFLRRLSREA